MAPDHPDDPSTAGRGRRSLTVRAPDRPSTTPPSLVETDLPTVDAPIRPAAVPVASPAGYEVLGVLGRGGMGVVYRARQAGLNRVVALKVVRADTTDAAGVARFWAEAEAVAAIRHPHVVHAYEFGQADGTPYLAMEYLSGGTLADRLRAGPLPPREAADLLAKLAGAVGAAHERGIVHRDLKPGNVLFDERGEPKVVDFGLAKLAASDLTQTQALMGTPHYMAPEQARGEAKSVGPTADVWALGVILFECLTGRRPFEADSAEGVLEKVRRVDPPSVRSLSRNVPADLQTVCGKCLSKDPARRYPTAQALADDLVRWLAGEPITARPTPAWERIARRARRRPTLVVGLAAGVVLLAAAGGLYRMAKERRHESARAEAYRELGTLTADPDQFKRVAARLDELRDDLPADEWADLHSRLTDGYAERLKAGLGRPNLSRADRERLTDGLAALRAKAPDQLAGLNEFRALPDDVRQWCEDLDQDREREAAQRFPVLRKKYGDDLAPKIPERILATAATRTALGVTGRVQDQFDIRTFPKGDLVDVYEFRLDLLRLANFPTPARHRAQLSLAAAQQAAGNVIGGTAELDRLLRDGDLDPGLRAEVLQQYVWVVIERRLPQQARVLIEQNLKTIPPEYRDFLLLEEARLDAAEGKPGRALETVERLSAELKAGPDGDPRIRALVSSAGLVHGALLHDAGRTEEAVRAWRAAFERVRWTEEFSSLEGVVLAAVCGGVDAEHVERWLKVGQTGRGGWEQFGPMVLLRDKVRDADSAPLRAWAADVVRTAGATDRGRKYAADYALRRITYEESLRGDVQLVVAEGLRQCVQWGETKPQSLGDLDLPLWSLSEAIGKMLRGGPAVEPFVKSVVVLCSGDPGNIAWPAIRDALPPEVRPTAAYAFGRLVLLKHGKRDQAREMFRCAAHGPAAAPAVRRAAADELMRLNAPGM